MIHGRDRLLDRIRAIHEAIRTGIVTACEETDPEKLSEVVAEEGGDAIFAIDRVAEATMIQSFSAVAAEWPCILVAEGLGSDGRLVLPAGTDPDAAEVIVLVDPIDGSRGLMVQKRPAWILTGVAPNRDGATLADIEIAVQTELPLQKQHLCDTLWAVDGGGACGERMNRVTGERTPLVPHPSRAGSIAGGYGSISRFFPGARALFAEIDDRLVRRLLGPPRSGEAQVFEDQYISTGGQLYELMMGRDRWQADLRSLAIPWLREHGLPSSHCCHPYDLCSELVARESGVVVVSGRGGPLYAPLDVGSDCSWIGCANAAIAGVLLPELQSLIDEFLPNGSGR